MPPRVLRWDGRDIGRLADVSAGTVSPCWRRCGAASRGLAQPAAFLAVVRTFLAGRPSPVPDWTGGGVPPDYEGPP
jgi:hypothetical protein